MKKPIDHLPPRGINGMVSTEQKQFSDQKISPDFIHNLKEGNEEAFYQLVTRYSGPLEDYVFQWLDRREDAEEAVQEVFVYLWEHRRNLTCESLPQLLKYIYIAGRTQSIRILRERKRYHQYSEYIYTSPSGFAESPDHFVELDQAEQAVLDVLKQMPPIRAAAYDMRYNEGMNYVDIARKLNITESTARSHVNHAVRDIKKAIKG